MSTEAETWLEQAKVEAADGQFDAASTAALISIAASLAQKEARREPDTECEYEPNHRLIWSQGKACPLCRAVAP